MLLFWEILLFLEPHVANVKSYHRSLENLRWNIVFVQDSEEFLTQTLEKPPYGLIPIIVRVSNLGRCVISLPHERFGTTWAIDQIGSNLVELPQAVTWPQSGKERPSRK